MCSKLKINTARPSSGVFFADFDQSAYQYSVSTFNFQQVFASRVWKTSNKVMKTQKAIYLFRNKSWKTYFIQWFIIALNWIWTYVWTLNCSRNPKHIIIVSCRFLICSIIAISQRFNLFCCIKPTTYFNN